MTQLKDFKYKPLTPQQLASLVYDLNKELVEVYARTGMKNEELSKKAQKMINRARLEGIL